MPRMPQQHCYFPEGNLEEVKEELYDVHKIHGSSYAFAAIRADGQVGWRGLSAGAGDFGTLKKTSRKPDKLVVNHFSIFLKSVLQSMLGIPGNVAVSGHVGTGSCLAPLQWDPTTPRSFQNLDLWIPD